ncbi:MAG: MFS transporter [Candidatus Micrarchaeia archaeon]
MKRLIAVNGLFTFISTCLAVIIPLYLLNNNFDLSTIGFILSIGPLSFLVLRLVFSVAADNLGTRHINILSSCSNAISIIVYAIANSPLFFGLGIIIEGIRNASFWAVARTDIIHNTKEHLEEALARYAFIRQLFDGLARVFAGVFITYLAFEGSFLLLFILSIAYMLLTMKSKNLKMQKRYEKMHFLDRIFKKRSFVFWHASLLELFFFLASNTLLVLLLPLYLKAGMNFSYEETGVMLAIFSLAIATGAFVSMRWHLNKRGLIIVTFGMVPLLVLLPYFTSETILILVLIALANGCGYVVVEYIVMDQIYRSKDISTDLGVLFAPLKLGEFILFALSGVIINRFGFGAMFFICALSMALFVIFGLLALRKPVNNQII